MTMITPSYLGETIEYSSLHACRSTLEDPTGIEEHYKQEGIANRQFYCKRLQQLVNQLIQLIRREYGAH